MRSGELSGLVRGIDSAFQVYAKDVVNQLGIFQYLNLAVDFSKENVFQLSIGIKDWNIFLGAMIFHVLPPLNRN